MDKCMREDFGWRIGSFEIGGTYKPNNYPYLWFLLPSLTFYRYSNVIQFSFVFLCINLIIEYHKK